jgi:hypothetical protein
MTLARTRLALVVLALSVLYPFIASAQSSTSSASGQSPLLLRNPSLSQDKIAFLYADDVWTVGRQGGEAERLTSDGKVVAGPFFSPDGSEIAYSAHLNGNVDVYVMPVNGGVPRRITWHPDGSVVVGWTPDGKRVLITNGATSFRDFLKLSTVHADGSGIPEPLPLPSGVQGSYSPDGERGERALALFFLFAPFGLLGVAQLLFHLELEVIGGFAELVHELADLASDLGETAGSEDDQRHDHQNDGVHHRHGTDEDGRVWTHEG